MVLIILFVYFWHQAFDCGLLYHVVSYETESLPWSCIGGCAMHAGDVPDFSVLSKLLSS